LDGKVSLELEGQILESKQVARVVQERATGAFFGSVVKVGKDLWRTDGSKVEGRRTAEEGLEEGSPFVDEKQSLERLPGGSSLGKLKVGHPCPVTANPDGRGGFKDPGIVDGLEGSIFDRAALLVELKQRIELKVEARVGDVLVVNGTSGDAEAGGGEGGSHQAVLVGFVTKSPLVEQWVFVLLLLLLFFIVPDVGSGSGLGWDDVEGSSLGTVMEAKEKHLTTDGVSFEVFATTHTVKKREGGVERVLGCIDRNFLITRIRIAFPLQRKHSECFVDTEVWDATVLFGILNAKRIRCFDEIKTSKFEKRKELERRAVCLISPFSSVPESLVALGSGLGSSLQFLPVSVIFVPLMFR
jgi:hypothetical protein